MERRQFLGGMAALAATGSVFAADDKVAMQVYKSRTCSCCNKWVDHMVEAGFAVTASNVANVNTYKQEFGVPPELGSCHTAIVEGYVVEGHVPADDVIRMLKLKPEIIGIAVPGMPLGSPGMESPNPQRYQTIAFSKDGTMEVWAVHGPEQEQT